MILVEVNFLSINQVSLTKNKIIIGFSVCFSLFLVWYFAIKESDYNIRFTVNTASGTVFQGVQEWSALQMESQKEKYSTIAKKNYYFRYIQN